MAIRCFFSARKNLNCVGRLQLLLSNDCSAVIGLYSTAAKQWGTGDGCHGDDTTDDSSHAGTNVRLLEMRASKLEEQVRELTVEFLRLFAFENKLLTKRTRTATDRKDTKESWLILTTFEEELRSLFKTPSCLGSRVSAVTWWR
ncbi:unnamed protein product [Oncorhynchus mykiss]|uniref:Uncharacterized protein n=1 Tax=Oncorhynchus mykiss TaxID=8022 RepID=A0A060XQN1_ONCMY|nr:unnamed protein product [Oncorhynchus mykiss]